MAKINRTLTYQGDILVHDTFDDVSTADGAYSWQFDGATQGVIVPHNTVLNFSNVDWTIEFWACPTATDAIERSVYAKRASAAIVCGVGILTNCSTGKWAIQISNAAGNAWTVLDSTTVPLDVGVWQHFALVRNGVNIYAYKNGVRYTLSTAMSTNAIFDDGAAASIGPLAVIPVGGATSYGAYRFRGYLSNLRVTKGAALYNAAIVTIPSSPLINQGTVTSLLTCQSTTFKDNSSYTHIIADSNAPTISYINPFTTEKSLKFNGSSQYLSFTGTSAMALSSGDFTIECWVNLTGYSLPYQTVYYQACIIGNSVTATTGMELDIYGSASSWDGITLFAKNAGGAVTVNIPVAFSFSLNTWYHIAVVRNSSTIKFYVNGTSIGSGAAAAWNETSTSWSIGSLRSTGYFYYLPGLISNFRVMKGVAVYTSNFAPPTAPLSGAGASLLTCTSGATLKDYSPNAFAITATGTPTVSYLNPFDTTLQSESSIPATQRFTNSVSFSETQYHSMSFGTSSLLALGAGNFTIEGWIYPTEWNTNTSIFWDYRTNGGAATNIPVLAFSATGVPQFYISPGSTVTITGSTIPTLNAWSHLALVRSGSTITMYLNGTSIGTATSSATLGIQTLAINNVQTAANYNQAGYYSNFRIVVGTAVYTGTFTPPTSPLQITQSAGTNIAAITDATQVRLLTCQEYGHFADNSIYDWIITTLPVALTTTARNTITTSTFSPFGTYQNPALTNNYYSTLFNGTSQYLTTGAAGLTSENFTIECWFRLTSNLTFISPESIYVGELVGSSVNNGMHVLMRGAGTNNNVPSIIGLDALGAGSTGGSVSVSGLSIPINTWHHLAISRSGSSYAIWFNGVKQSVTIARAGNNYAAGVYYIGFNAESASYRYWFPGYISNLRITRETPIYDPAGGNITVPTAPLTAINGTYLLACQSPVVTIDNSTTPHSITATGATTDTLNPFRTQNDYSVSFNGTNQYLSNATNNTALAMGAGDFTIEFWMRATSTATSVIYDSRINTGTATGGFQIAIISGTIGVYGGPSTGTTLCTSVSISTNRWYHVAVVRNGSGTGNVKLYIDGFLSSTYGSADTANYSLGYLNIGCYLLGGSPALYFNGYISNWRMVKGTAVYTSNFTPPVQPLTAISGTSLLTCTRSQIRDYSDNRFAITNNGTATVSSTVYPPFTTTSTSQPEFPVSKLTSGGSLMTNNHLDEYSILSRTYATYFNGTNQYLTTPSNPLFSFGLGDFTVEAWIWYFPLVGNTFGKMILDGRPAATNGPYFNFGLDNTGKLAAYLGSNGYISPSALTTRTWIHVAVTRKNGTVRLFVNGAIVTTGTGNTDSITSGGYYIGQNSFMAADTYFNGYISNARIVKGLALYTDTFTPPTSPLTNINGLGYETSLLALQSSSATTENSSNALTLTAFNGPLTTTNIQTGLYSGFFNGTNQYMTVPSDAAFSFGTGDFTVECWLWTPAFTNTYGRIIVDARPTGTNGSYWLWGLDNIGRPNFVTMTTGGATITGSSSVATSSWVHFAVTRQSGTIRLFINGVSAATPITGNVDNISSSGLRIGFNAFATVGGFAAETLWNGHLSNLRIIKGTAVYTTGFTPPTLQLAVIPSTSLLLFQNATVTKDNSVNNFTITNFNSTTAVASISWPTVQKQYTTGVTEIAGVLDDYTKTGAVSALFDGNQSLSLLTQSAFGYGTGDFTIEFWLRLNAISLATILSNLSADASAAPHIYLTAGGVITYFTSGAGRISGATLSTGIWYHVALTRASGSTKLFINGVQSGSTYTDATNYGSSNPIAIGDYFQFYPALSGTARLNGYVSNFRITKGVAVYTGNFTPSTLSLKTTQAAGTNIAAITSPSSVSLLTCQNINIIDNSSNGFTLTNNGNVTTTIKQIPF